MAAGLGVGAGSVFNLPGKSGKAAALNCRFDGSIPLLSSWLSMKPNAGWEYMLMRVESNNVGKTVQTARAQYLRMGMQLHIRLLTTRKQSGIELGGGIAFRQKIHESSDWQLTGGQPVSYFPQSQMLAPVQLSRFTENDKRRITLFAEVVINADTKTQPINGIHAGIQWQWFTQTRKHYYKGTHRTLQHDDVWPIQHP